MRNSTFFSYGRKSENLPKRTWKGEQAKVPSSRSTTITSMAPLSVAGLMEFQAVETESLRFRTYCIVPTANGSMIDPPQTLPARYYRAVSCMYFAKHVPRGRRDNWASCLACRSLWALGRLCMNGKRRANGEELGDPGTGWIFVGMAGGDVGFRRRASLACEIMGTFGRCVGGPSPENENARNGPLKHAPQIERRL